MEYSKFSLRVEGQKIVVRAFPSPELGEGRPVFLFKVTQVGPQGQERFLYLDSVNITRPEEVRGAVENMYIQTTVDGKAVSESKLVEAWSGIIGELWSKCLAEPLEEESFEVTVNESLG